MKSIIYSCIITFVVAVAAPTTSAESNAGEWNQWGGPNRNFKVDVTGLADSWPPNGPRKLWARELGEGYSGIVGGAQAVYTMYRDGDNDVIVALATDIGSIIWEHKYEAKPDPKAQLRFGTGPNATPLLLPDRLITIGFTGRLTCVSRTDGKPLWSHDLVSEYKGKVFEFGHSASPILYDGNVIVLVGGDETGVMAFKPEDGSVVWQSKKMDVSYASPIIINVDGKDQLVFMASTEVVGMDPKNGKRLWKAPCKNEYKNNAADPVWGPDNLLWVATQQDGGARVLQLKTRAGKTKAKKLWESNKIRIFHWNAIGLDSFVYAAIGDSAQRLAAIDMRTGDIKWRQDGFGKINAVYADGKMILLDDDGQLALARVSPEKCDILSKTQLLEKVAWTAPSLIGRTLYVRDKKSIMALDLSAAQ